MAAQALRMASGPKDLYEIGEIPPLGHVPAQMHAWAIRRERHGPPEVSMQRRDCRGTVSLRPDPVGVHRQLVAGRQPKVLCTPGNLGP